MAFKIKFKENECLSCLHTITKLQCIEISFYLIPLDLITWRDVEIKIDFQWKVIFDIRIPAFNFTKRWGFLMLSRAYLKTYNTASSAGIRFLFSHANNKLYCIFHSIYMNISTLVQKGWNKICKICMLRKVRRFHF